MPFYAQLTIPFFMILSGLTWDASAARHSKWYTKKNLLHKFKRMALPYLPALLLEVLVLGLPDDPLIWLASGGYQMPGSYYVILMFQLILLFPFIRRFYNWNKSKGRSWLVGLAMIFLFHCVYELLTYVFRMPLPVYRLLVLRYIVFIYSGICLHRMILGGKLDWKDMRWMLPIGAAFILAIGYLGWQPKVLFRYSTWYRSSAPTVFWTLPILALVFRHKGKILAKAKRWKAGQWMYKTLQLCGKASYHVYIVQMLWFGMVISRFNTASYRQVIILVISVPVCCFLGIGYYLLTHIKITAKDKETRDSHRLGEMK